MTRQVPLPDSVPDPESSDDPQAVAIECAERFENVALSGDQGFGFGSVTMEVSNVFLPDLLRGIDVSHAQLVPMGPPSARRLEWIFTTEPRDV